MFSIQFLLFLVFSFVSANKLSSKEFCNLNNNLKQCQHPFSYQCGKSKCSLNETVCRIYSDLDMSLRAGLFETNLEISLLTTQVRSLYSVIRENLNNFNSKIQNCSFVASEWKPTDICVSGKNCYQIIKSRWVFLSTQMIGMRNQLKKKSCPCIGDHTFACASDYCTSDKHTCDVFDYKNQKISEAYATTIGITKCDNDFVLLN